MWGLRTDICLWKGGLVSGKFPNLGACELKISKFGGLWAENFQIWGLVSYIKFGWKLRLLRLKFQNFLKRGSCELTLLLEMGPLRAAGEVWQGGLRAAHPHTPFLGQCPPRSCFANLINNGTAIPFYLLSHPHVSNLTILFCKLIHQIDYTFPCAAISVRMLTMSWKDGLSSGSSHQHCSITLYLCNIEMRVHTDSFKTMPIALRHHSLTVLYSPYNQAGILRQPLQRGTY